MNRKSIAYAGIIICIIYFLVVFVLILTNSKGWLTAMEIVTMVSGIFMLLLILFLPSTITESSKIFRIVSIVFVAGTMILTNVAHFVNLTVIEQLLRLEVDVPEYFKIGKWPSIEMAIDYLAWGLFMGIAFLTSLMYIPNEKIYKNLKIILFVCGILCLLGFFGININVNLWYIAPLGYGVGTVVICVELLLIQKKISQI